MQVPTSTSTINRVKKNLRYAWALALVSIPVVFVGGLQFNYLDGSLVVVAQAAPALLATIFFSVSGPLIAGALSNSPAKRIGALLLCLMATLLTSVSTLFTFSNALGLLLYGLSFTWRYRYQDYFASYASYQLAIALGIPLLIVLVLHSGPWHGTGVRVGEGIAVLVFVAWAYAFSIPGHSQVTVSHASYLVDVLCQGTAFVVLTYAIICAVRIVVVLAKHRQPAHPS